MYINYLYEKKDELKNRYMYETKALLKIMTKS